MIVHISYDEKFLGDVIKTSSNVQEEGVKFFVLGDESHKKHVKSDQVQWFADWQLVKDELALQHEVSILFHSFSLDYVRIINALQKRTDVVFILLLYGIELFDLDRYRDDFLMEKTKAYLNKANRVSFRSNPIRIIKAVKNKRQQKGDKRQLDKSKIDAFKELDAVAHFCFKDIELYLKPLASEIQWIEWSFFSHHSFITPLPGPVNNDRILLGNSASEYNNHFDAISKLHEVDLQSQLLVPLSYGGNKGYVTNVIRYGREKFGDRFTPMLEYLDTELYYNEILKCRAAVFFNIRSQAAGNIFNLIHTGTPVFMSRASTLYHYLIGNGIKVFSIEEDLEELGDQELRGTYESELTSNGRIISELFSESETIHRYKNLYKCRK